MRTFTLKLAYARSLMMARMASSFLPPVLSPATYAPPLRRVRMRPRASTTESEMVDRTGTEAGFSTDGAGAMRLVPAIHLLSIDVN